MSFVTSLFQSFRWSWVEELTAPLFKSPEWNFAQEVADNRLNQNIQLESTGRSILPDGKCGYDPIKVFAGPDFKHDFVEKRLTPYQMLDSKGQLYEAYYAKSAVPTSFHSINVRLVASVKILKSNPHVKNKTLEKVRSIERREISQKTDSVVQAKQNDNFNKCIINEISDWNAAMHSKLFAIFVSSVVLGAMIPILIIKTACIAFAALATIRLLQLYSLQKQNSKIINVGHWVVQLWKAFSLNPMLRSQYGCYYDEIFFSERKVLEFKSVSAKTEDQKTTAEKPPTRSLTIDDYRKYCEDFRNFADPLVAKKCDTVEETHKWVTDFFDQNPFKTDLFKGNPELPIWPPKEKWKRIKVFQFHYLHLKQQYDNLTLHWQKIQPKIQDKAKMKCESMKSQVEAAAKTAAKTLALDDSNAQQYQVLLMQVFDEELTSKISELGSVGEEHRGVFAYSQVDDFFKKAYHELILGKKPFILIPATWQKMITDFQDDLDKISQNYPQNVISKAKALFQDPAFHTFVDRVFKPA